MDLMDRIRVSDWISGIGGIVLFISVFLEWFNISYQGFTVKGTGASGWDASKLTLILLLTAIVVLAIVVLRILDIDLSVIPIPMSLIIMALGAVCLLIVVIRIFVHQEFLGVSYGIFISLAATIAVIAGGAVMQREGMY